MPSPYSSDLRSRVISAVESGVCRSEISEIFQVGTATITRWWSRYKNEGHFTARDGYQKGHSHKIKDLEKFKIFVKENQSLTTKEMAVILGGMSGETVRSTLKKIEYSRKKVFLYMERDESK